ncbi:MAG TPA: aminoglycoside 6-adenylyltransferase [Parafilimonas sp.]|nr:aminoglycoside 6-adenylyltransferase [Parafilimonas sp.]
MRSQDEVMELILRVASADDRIRAVFLGGSRANSNAPQDILQDFDVTYVVSQIDSFLRDHSWIDVFGERLIVQMPEEMTIGEKDKYSFHYLMLFKDGVRIDLTLLPLSAFETGYKHDSLTILLLDKDAFFEKLPPETRADYYIKRPTEKEFNDCCNEFWWVSTYVAKGLWRHELIYAKTMLDNVVRSMFLKMIEWYIGTQTDFKVSFGKSGRNVKQHVSPELYAKILSTYQDSDINNTWRSLFTMTSIFSELANEVAADQQFKYNVAEQENVTAYLKSIYKMQAEK